VAAGLPDKRAAALDFLAWDKFVTPEEAFSTQGASSSNQNKTYG
jgi:hypothetical protein